MPAPIEIPPQPPIILGNGEEVAGSPWLTDPNHPLHKDHPRNAHASAPDTRAPGVYINGVLRANVVDGAIVALPEVTP